MAEQSARNVLGEHNRTRVGDRAAQHDLTAQDVSPAPEGLPRIVRRARRGRQTLPLGPQLVPSPRFSGQCHPLCTEVRQQPIALLKQPLDGRSVRNCKPHRADAVLHPPIPFDQYLLHRRAQGRLFRRRATQRVACHRDGYRQPGAANGDTKVAPQHDDLAGLGNRSHAQRRSAVRLLSLDLQCQCRLGLHRVQGRVLVERKARLGRAARKQIHTGRNGERTGHVDDGQGDLNVLSRPAQTAIAPGGFMTATCGPSASASNVKPQAVQLRFFTG